MVLQHLGLTLSKALWRAAGIMHVVFSEARGALNTLFLHSRHLCDLPGRGYLTDAKTHTKASQDDAGRAPRTWTLVTRVLEQALPFLDMQLRGSE